MLADLTKEEFQIWFQCQDWATWAYGKEDQADGW